MNGVAFSRPANGKAGVTCVYAGTFSEERYVFDQHVVIKTAGVETLKNVAGIDGPKHVFWH